MISPIELDDNTATKLLLKGWSCDTCRKSKDVLKRIGWHCDFFKYRPKMNICRRVTKFDQHNNMTFTEYLPIKVFFDTDGVEREKIDIKNA